jgi:hypothetical protein
MQEQMLPADYSPSSNEKYNYDFRMNRLSIKHQQVQWHIKQASTQLLLLGAVTPKIHIAWLIIPPLHIHQITLRLLVMRQHYLAMESHVLPTRKKSMKRRGSVNSQNVTGRIFRLETIH